MKYEHIAIYMHQSQTHQDAIDALVRSNIIPINDLKGGVFSNYTLKLYLKEEHRHSKINVTSSTNDSLSTMSSGQQSKALLLHMFAKNIDYIILDDVFGYLDKENCLAIAEMIKEFSSTVSIIQFSYRKEDMFDWIKNTYYLTDDGSSLREFDKQGMLNSLTKNFNIEKVLSSTKTTVKQEKEELIRFNNVSVKYGEKEVFNNLNWTVNQGDFWQIIGPNGSGKSTILSMIYGDNVKAFGQDVILFGKMKGSGESIWDIKKKIGYFAKNTIMLHPRSDTIQEMIIGGLYDSIGLYQKPSYSDLHLSMEWIKALDLVKIKDKPFKDQSSGIQSIVMVARAMIKEPILLILDEPTTGLDDENAKLLVELISAIAKTKMTTILYVSHRQEEGLHAEKILKLGK